MEPGSQSTGVGRTDFGALSLRALSMNAPVGVQCAYGGKVPVAKKKEYRFHLRASERDVFSIKRAAESTGVSVSAFILESAAERAERTFADRSRFVLSAAQWRAFTQALDRPARRIPQLERLLREPSILERPGAS